VTLIYSVVFLLRSSLYRDVTELGFGVSLRHEQCSMLYIRISHFHSDDCRMPSSGMWSRVDLVKTDFSEECVSSIFRVEKIASEEKR
jgi:hypothetical protein